MFTAGSHVCDKNKLKVNEEEKEREIVAYSYHGYYPAMKTNELFV